MRFFQLLTAALVPVTMVSATARPAVLSRDLGSFSALELLNALESRDMALMPRSELAARQDLTSALGNLGDLLASLKQFLNAEFLNDTHAVVTNLADLLADPFVKETRSIIDSAGGLLSSLSPVIDALGKIDIGGLVSSLSSLLTTDSINGLKTLLANAELLLTKDFANQTRDLIAQVAPLVSAVSQFITALIGALLG
ncbi:hypothetical protein GQ53DRAFT_773351 [Thozetella sp. PMI_491]|nr:hypothetical protein GQ53DRAFT_773351 [Thozetella sp. PMI_491]